MIRRLSWLIIFLGIYFWITTSEEKIDFSKKAKIVYDYAKKKWDEMAIDVHIHTLECFKNEKKRR